MPSLTLPGWTDFVRQLMSKLDLADARLTLPVPVYAISGDAASAKFATVTGLKSGGARRLAFLALDRPVKGRVAVIGPTGESGGLQVAEEPAGKAAPLFCALPADTKSPPPTAVPLFEFANADSKQRAYSVDPDWAKAGLTRAARPLCLVWRNPMQVALPDE
jgi:hypothetical protein